MARAVLLDAFGTLVELEPAAPRLRAELRTQLGLSVTAAEAERAMAAEIAFYRAHHDTAHDAESLGALRRRCAEVTRGALPAAATGAPLDKVLAALLDALRFRAFADVPDALRELRSAGTRLVVVSNWDVSLPDSLAAAGLDHLLDGVVSSAAVGKAKPHPEIFVRALEVAGASAAEAIHVGDSLEHDVAGARAAGIEPVLLRRGAGSRSPDVRTITSLAELVSEEPYPSRP